MTELRPGRAQDAAVLTEIAHAAKRHWGYPQTWLEMWQKDLTVTPQYIAHNPVYVAQSERTITGFIALALHQPEVEIDHLWVLPEHMGQGIGRLLLRRALQHCMAGGFHYLRVVADPNAAAFYCKLGAQYEGSIDAKPAPRKLPLLCFDLLAFKKKEEK